MWFTADHRARRYRREAVCEIDGDKIANEYSFHCALGEAVNGPGGYYGSNLDALDDCLRGIRAGDIGFQLVWRGFSESQK
ncbi:barstar family protein, partial [Sinosporangium album]|uniref:barstar family protein n=1 Tax=Sinosporangium album TaxID=504805 RepID=UPI0015A37C9A